MNTLMRPVLLLAGLGLAVCAAGRARADLITQHAQTVVQATAGDLQNGDLERGALASASAAAQSYTNSAGQSESDGSATSGGAAGSYVVWSVASDAHASRFKANDSRVDSSASWSDILFLGSTNTVLVGSILRLTFVAQGTVTATNQDILGYGSPTTGVMLSANNGDGTPGYSAGGGTSLDRFGFHSHGWNSISGNDQGYNGILQLDIPIPRGNGYVTPGSIFFSIVDTSITAIAGTDGNPHSGDIVASDPISLQSITLPDVGNVTPESLGVSLTFDSGLLSPNIQSVPEPSSLTLALASALGWLAYAWHRRAKP